MNFWLLEAVLENVEPWTILGYAITCDNVNDYIASVIIDCINLLLLVNQSLVT